MKSFGPSMLPKHPDPDYQRLQIVTVMQNELAALAFKGDMDGFQKRLLEGSRHLLESDAALLVLADEENPGLLVYKSLNPQLKWAQHLQPDSGKGPISDSMLSGKIIFLEGEEARLDLDPTCTDEYLLQARSLICAPLRVDECAIGALLVLNKQGGNFDDRDQLLFSSIAELASNGIHGIRLLRQYKIASADLEADRWELIEARNFLRALFDHLPVSLYLIDHEFRLLSVNNSRLDQAGLENSLITGRLCYQAFFNRTEPCPECRVLESLQEGQITKRNERRRINEVITDWEINTYPILDHQNQVTQAILLEVDTTEKRHLEATLIQFEKLAAVGQLAAGVAHEINNPLTAIIANAQILRRELPPDSDLQESVDLISRAGARAALVVRNLLDFARKEDYRLRLTEVNETVEHAIELIQHEVIARGINLELDLDPALPALMASPDHLQSVWLNLLLNAIDALDKSPEKIRVVTLKSENKLQISVIDNGRGIASEHIKRIFEPFYTTKAPGRGTGLGLSVSQRIVKQHHGHFKVESHVGEGSVFTVILPLP
jgi:two-component system NtrC family sensor kinase